MIEYEKLRLNKLSSTKTQCQLTVIVPCHNEERFIGNTIKNIRNLKKNFPDYEIIICEDGSTDGTVKILGLLEDMYPEVTVYHSEKRMGKGLAIIQGVINARGKMVAFVDSDLPTDVGHLIKFYSYIEEGYDLVIGQRDFSSTKRPMIRNILSYCFNLLTRILFQTKIKDHQCGFKIFNKEKIEKFLSKIKNFNFLFDAELIIRCKEAGYRIKEIPIPWEEPKNRNSKVSILRDSFKMGSKLFSLRIYPKFN